MGTELKTGPIIPFFCRECAFPFEENKPLLSLQTAVYDGWVDEIIHVFSRPELMRQL